MVSAKHEDLEFGTRALGLLGHVKFSNVAYYEVNLKIHTFIKGDFCSCDKLSN